MSGGQLTAIAPVLHYTFLCYVALGNSTDQGEKRDVLSSHRSLGQCAIRPGTGCWVEFRVPWSTIRRVFCEGKFVMTTAIFMFQKALNKNIDIAIT